MTLAELIAQRQDAALGSVLIDDRLVRDHPVTTLRASIDLEYKLLV